MMRSSGHCRCSSLKSRNRFGFSLIEAVISILVMTITGAALFGTLGTIKMIQDESRAVNAINRVGTAFLEQLRSYNYLTLNEALTNGDYRFEDFRYYYNQENDVVVLINPYVIYELRSVCAQYRVQESIRVNKSVESMRFSVSFQRTNRNDDVLARMVCEVSQNGINFR